MLAANLERRVVGWNITQCAAHAHFVSFVVSSIERPVDTNDHTRNCRGSRVDSPSQTLIRPASSLLLLYMTTMGEKTTPSLVSL